MRDNILNPFRFSVFMALLFWLRIRLYIAGNQKNQTESRKPKWVEYIIRKKQLFITAIMLLLSLPVLATDIANLPLNALNTVKPNLIFALDDSGSMDFEVLLNTNDGALWWDGSARSFTDTDGEPWFNATGITGSDGKGHTWYKYVYLFPNGSAQDAREYTDTAAGSYGFFAIPPLPAYAYMRSSDYNPLYYNPYINYSPWVPAYISGTTQTYNNINPAQAPSHPLYNMTSLNLIANLSSQASNWTFRMVAGMVIPGARVSGITGRKNGSGSWQSITNNYAIPSGEYWDVAIPYYPATYYLKDASCTSGSQCFTGPDGSRLRQYQIKSTVNSYPSGRNYAAEMQNFANWFSYYRKRKFMLSGAMGTVFSQLNGLRAGIVQFNNLASVTMYDFDNPDNSQNSKVLLGIIYNNPSNGGTPTRDALNYVGNQYMKNNKIIQYACQANAAMVLTDGFAYMSNPSVPSYNQSTWGGTAPYTTTYSKTLADIALAYYSINLRPDLPTGLVPLNPNNTGPNADQNNNLHMNTYALSLGALGTIYGTGSAQATNPYLYPPSWPNPNINANPTAIDDLWHATINARGAMFTAYNTSNVISYLQNLIGQVFLKAGSNSAVSIANVNVSASNNTIFVSSYTGSYGELQPYTVNVNSGQISVDSQAWSASNLLDQKTPSNRAIATYNGTTGIPFQWTSLPSSMQTALNSATSPPGPSDGQNVLAWLRGNQSLEGVNYRVRAHLLGDIVDAEPVPVIGAMANYIDAGYATFANTISNRTPMVYQAANDGMLHAFNANTGQEVWAYIPNLVFNNLKSLASAAYSHLFYVDGTPVVNDVADASNTWHTLLIGGLRAGGKGYYALDITNPAASTDSDAAAKVLWEFPNNATSSSVKANMGLSFGKPVIAKTKAAGWVVLVTSGYNNTTGDGKGHLFVLNPFTGTLIADIATPSGSTSNLSGLAQISGYAQNNQFDATIDYVYGGDLQGNLWRFDLSGSTTSSWNISLLATLVDDLGNPQPITTAPELTIINGRRMVYVGTGQLLGSSDLSTTQVQSMYGLVDNLSSTPTISPLRSNLVQKQVNNNTISNSTVDYTRYRGWVFDFPSAGERATTDPVLAQGVLVFNTNQPSATACTSSSFEYIVDPNTGGQVAGQLYNGLPVSRIAISNSFSSKPLIILLPNGQMASLIHTADNTITNIALPPAALTGIAKKIGWKEVLRQ